MDVHSLFVQTATSPASLPERVPSRCSTPRRAFRAPRHSPCSRGLFFACRIRGLFADKLAFLLRKPFAQHGFGGLEPDATRRRKGNDDNLRRVHRKCIPQCANDVPFRLSLPRGRELVHLRCKEQHGAPAAEITRQEIDVELGKAVPRIDDQDEADERLARGDITAEESLPMPLERKRHRRVSVSRQVGE